MENSRRFKNEKLELKMGIQRQTERVHQSHIVINPPNSRMTKNRYKTFSM
jgi:hypothetical protein